MANIKTYTVVKDGKTLKELKTLAAAKKLADAEGAEVRCDGESVYTPIPAAPPASPAVAETAEPAEERVVEPAKEKYKLLSRMNIRIAPSLEAGVVGIAEPETVVDVLSIENDWMRVKNGTGVVFILYGGGKFAERV